MAHAFLRRVALGSLAFGCTVALAALTGCKAGESGPPSPVVHPLTPQTRIRDHAQRLSDGIARYREVKGSKLPMDVRELTLTLSRDGQSCFTENLKDHWFHPYAYSPVDERSGTFVLASAGQNGQLGDADDLRVERGPGDPRVRTYGWTWHDGE